MTPRDKIVMEAVRRADPDRYLSALYAPQASRAGLLALYAFDAEIAAIRDRTRESLPGEIRIQWWHEVIDPGADRSADGHPLAEALLDTIVEHGLPRAAFANYLEARLFDLFNDPMPSKDDLEGYCGETASAIMQLASLILDASAAPRHADLAGHAGCAQAIAGMLRQLPLHRGRGQCFVPRDILAAAGTSPEEFLAGGDEPAAGRAVAAMVALAEEHMAALSKQAKSLPEKLRPAFLPLALVPAQLKRIAARGAISLSRPQGISAWRSHWLLFRAAANGF